jgi:hypothetical protein
LRPSVESLDAAIQSEKIAHVLTLFRYVRLQQQLMDAKGWPRNQAAHHLNEWIAAAYEGQPGAADMLARIKHDAHRLFDLFSEPANDDGWGPDELETIAADGSRAKHLLEAAAAAQSLSRAHPAPDERSISWCAGRTAAAAGDQRPSRNSD